MLDSEGTGVTPRDERTRGFLIRGSQFLQLGTNASVGSFVTTQGSDAEIRFTPSMYCDGERAADYAPASEMSPFYGKYVVDDRGRLVIYESEISAFVYVPSAKLCGSPRVIPDKPGSDSSSCEGSYCGCAENMDAAPNAETCAFIDP